MKKIAVIIASLFLVGSIAHAAPVYLDCVAKLQNPENPPAPEFKFGVMVDEANGNVTHTDADGKAFNAKGFFSANEISYKSPEPRPPTSSDPWAIRTTYQIDRTTLSDIETFRLKSLGEASEKPPRISTGKCQIIDVTKRKI